MCCCAMRLHSPSAPVSVCRRASAFARSRSPTSERCACTAEMLTNAPSDFGFVLEAYILKATFALQ